LFLGQNTNEKQYKGGRIYFAQSFKDFIHHGGEGVVERSTPMMAAKK
jgi:hypothetical protein